MLTTLGAAYGLDIHSASVLVGGYDEWASSWLLDTDAGALVVRLDRSLAPETAGWLGGVIDRAARAGVPCHAPLPAREEAIPVTADGVTVTVTPYETGVNLDRDDPAQVESAGAVLGRLHGALRGTTEDRPSPSPWAACLWPGDSDPSELRDPALDEWHDAFVSSAGTSFASGVVHGDFWAGNLLWSGGEIAAVIDWSEARVDALSRELAWATWEFGHDDARLLDVDRARTFLRGYREVTGPWEPGLREALISLMRVELRLNARYSLDDPGDEEYNSALREAFSALRGQSAVPLLEAQP